MKTIYQGVRTNSSAFLDGKPNIALVSKSQAKKLLLDGTAVTSAVAVCNDGEELTVKARKEVIMSCGVFKSPKLLMLSGIGQ